MRLEHDRFSRQIRWIISLIKPIGLGLTAIVAIGLLSGCQSTVPPVPTEIPTAITPTVTVTLTIAPSMSVTPTASLPNTLDVPSATFRPMATATYALPQKVTALLLTATPTPKAFCITAQSGDTIVSLLAKGGYADTGAASAFRQLNGMAPDSNVISAGHSYCIPQFTPTPTPRGYELTYAAQRSILPTDGPTAPPGEYIVKDTDTALSIEINTGVALSVICSLNPLPNGLN